MTTRITTRPIAISDTKLFVAASRASRDLHKPWVTAPCDEDAFNRYVARFDGKLNHGFVVHIASSGELVGAINLTNIVLGAFRSGYLGYFAFSGFAGRGFMQQGLRAVVQHAFRDLKLHRLEANIQPGNASSIALVRKCGFQKEGFSPAYLKIGGRWRDHERWAIVKGTANAA
ncbi:GNAT family N-acetyltransferase [Curvibacter sp. CHRR-16]|uniref:GNAT family N-acetyltransferase n=1 Tax=Curvibacter sp. CHRR-16 TaxID=2835872 RepID=UPI001BDAA9B8|nr:GNAT family protein [Curvibacter sp. CHRR-16]MBT0571707.1 GNAT family N-acetyltransferase [Curvibacter sp. CHRR-16]